MPNLSLETRLKIAEMLADDMPERAIASRLGISRAHVQRVRKHGVHYKIPGLESPLPPEHAKGPVLKCSGCGYKVEHPCRICRDRALRKKRRAELDAQAERETVAEMIANTAWRIHRAGGDWEIYHLYVGLHDSRTLKRWNAIADELRARGIEPPTPVGACAWCGSLDAFQAEGITHCRACGCCRVA